MSCYGSRDLEAGLPVEPDTLWRIYSMTKPVTSVAAMVLYEEGALELSDPVSKFIPAFAGVRVYAGGSDQRQVTVPAAQPPTVGYMARNHLPGGLDLETFGRPLYAESPLAGVGFGLGFSVVIDPVPSRVVCSEGELSWGGAASTAFWIDQREELAVAFYTQLLPSSTYRIRPQLRQLVYHALTG